MTYQVLARQWRPRSFDAVVGQESVLQALINSLDSQRLHHAYLFTGTRGVGKTTLARLLAKALNCEKGVSSHPCGECTACREIDAGRFLDLIEIDAASRTKVEDTRDILSTVQYAPASGRFKVYLIDEIHMLSTHSFNALLKTLEEPPPHVKFLFATTDQQKLPATVLSRCIQFNLKNILPEQIIKQLAHILTTENIPYEDAALVHIARAASGSMRDALSLLDQAIAYSNRHIQEFAVRQMLGLQERQSILQLLDALIHRSAEQVIKLSEELAQQGADFAQLLDEILSVLHQLAVWHAIPAATDLTLSSPDPSLMALMTKISREDIQLFYQIGLLGSRDLALAPTMRIGFEMTLLRMLTFRPADPLNAKQIEAVTQTVAESTPTSSTSAKPVEPVNRSAAPSTPPAARTREESKPAIVSPLQSAIKSSAEPAAAFSTENWRDMIPRLKLTGMANTLVLHTVLQEISEQRVKLLLDPKQRPLLNEAVKTRIASAFNQYLKRPVELSIELATSDAQTPQMAVELQKKTAINQATSAVNSNPQIKSILQQFDATIIEGSITPT